MTLQSVSTTRSFSEEDLKPQSKSPSSPRLTALIFTLLGLIASLTLLGLSASVVSYDRSAGAHTGRTEVLYLYMDRNLTRNETGYINNLPEQYNDNSFFSILGVSAYCVVVYILLAVALWQPANKSPFMHMNIVGLILSFSLVAFAPLAQMGSAAYAIVEDNRSVNITAQQLHEFRNGTLKGQSAPASWNCELYSFATEPARQQELNQLCSDAKTALAFTVVCTLLALSVSAIMTYFMVCMRRRRMLVMSERHAVVQ